MSVAGDDDDEDYEDDYEDDEFESDDECEEALEVIYFEDEDEIHYGSGLPFWLLEAEAVLELQMESWTHSRQAASGDSPARDSAEASDTINAQGWPIWLVEAEAALAHTLEPPEAPAVACGSQSPIAVEADSRPKLKRSGSFERRRSQSTSSVAAQDKKPETQDKPKLTRSGSFERRRSQSTSSAAQDKPKLVRSGSFERRRKQSTGASKSNPGLPVPAPIVTGHSEAATAEPKARVDTEAHDGEAAEAASRAAHRAISPSSIMAS